MDLDSSPDMEPELTADGASVERGEQSPDSSRRRFTRNAVLGGAVLLSLGNRAAWGYTGNHVGECMSGPTLASFTLNGNQFASFNPAHDAELAQDIVDLVNDNHSNYPSHTACSDGNGGYCVSSNSGCPRSR